MNKIGVSLLAVIALATVHITQAQQSRKVPRIGILHPGSPPNPYIEGFRQGLRELGYIEGGTIVLEERWAARKTDRLPIIAEELVRLNVDLILTSTTPAILAAKQATSKIPIVMGGSADPVATGIVASLARPGGNVTGLSLLAPDLDGKRLELLKETVPKLSVVAIFQDPTNRGMALRFKEAEIAAGALGIRLHPVEVQQPYDFENAFSVVTRERSGALLVAGLFVVHRKQIGELAIKNRVPTLSDTGEYVEAGGLMAYGPSIADLHRRAATYVDKILKGTRPGDLPIEQPTKFELFLNLQTAKQIGVTIPQWVLYRADRVIR